ncbi:peptidyl-tRNA hydrolase II [Dendrothele bispora CBS 962.96]|uniref:peptidyl-tRNA hydrolase n=1 Tax=Dendrothele bispora (strain CBS 962.96) TaxID=1314807 RepID=A0A4S8MW72_DENBC|nr:peptidyl-tRNA hydrolase II [Dendrothele bispora CBS 962.96]
MSRLQSSQLVIPLLLGTVSAALGFILGRQTARDPVNYTNIEPSLGDNDDDEEDAEAIPDGDLSAISAGLLEPCKMVLIVRTDLKMSPGKISAQCGHATLACYKALVKKNTKLVRHWERTGQAKIALKATSEDQLLELEALAKSLNLCARSIEDAGRTEVEPGTRTVLAIGPAPVDQVNMVTGKLRLL